MPRLTDVRLVYASTIEVTFSTSVPLAVACDTAVLQVTDARSGSQLALRIERGLVVDYSLWDSARRLRQGLPATDVEVSGRTVTCVFPRMLVPVSLGTTHLSASLIVNGAPMTRVPVRLEAHAVQRGVRGQNPVLEVRQG